MQKKKAVTLIELLVTMTVVGVLYMFLAPVIKGVIPNSSKIMLKKAYNTIERNVSNLINNEVAYSDPDLGFAYTEEVDGKNRFCHYFFKQLNTVELSDNQCIGETADGVIYSIDAAFGLDEEDAPDISKKATIRVTEPKGGNFVATVDYDGKINVTGDIVEILKNPMDND